MSETIGIGKVTSSNRIPITSIKDFLKVSKGDYVKFVINDEGKVFIQKA